MQDTEVSAVVVAAGEGVRMGGLTPKQYIHIGSRSILEHALAPLVASADIIEVVLVLAPGDRYFSDTMRPQHKRLYCVEGGKTRMASVWAGVQRVQTPWVVVHDAARPCLLVEDLDRLLAQRSGSEGAILATPLRDTLKIKSGEDCARNVEGEFFQAMTPQLFSTAFLKKIFPQALASCRTYRDEAALCEAYGAPPRIVLGSLCNIKVTYPSDVVLVARLLREG